MVKMVGLKHSPKADFSSWEWSETVYDQMLPENDIQEICDEFVQKIQARLNGCMNMAETVASDAVQSLVDEGYISASLPIMWAYGGRPSDGWGGPPVTDPLMINVCIGTQVVEGPVVSVPFEELVWDALELFQHSLAGRTVIDDEAGIATAKSIRDGLRELADKIDEVIDDGGGQA